MSLDWPNDPGGEGAGVRAPAQTRRPEACAAAERGRPDHLELVDVLEEQSR